MPHPVYLEHLKQTVTCQFPFHPAANLLPWMTGDEWTLFLDSVREEGCLIHAIAVWQNQILDGRHREVACILLGVPSRYFMLPDSVNPYLYVWTANLARRSLPTSTRLKLCRDLLPHLRADQATRTEVNQQVAAMATTGERTASKLITVLESGRDDMIEKVMNEEWTINRAYRLLQEPPSRAITRVSRRRQAEAAKRQPPPDTDYFDHANQITNQLNDNPEPPATDASGQVVPENLKAIFTEGVALYEKAIQGIYACRTSLAKLRKHDAGVSTDCQSWHSYTVTIEKQLRAAMPACVHAPCGGQGCSDCQQRGWLARHDLPRPAATDS